MTSYLNFKKYSKQVLFVLLVSILTTFSGLGQNGNWVATWSCAPYAAGSTNTPPPPYLTNNTLRQVVRVSIGGDTLRLKFSNKTSPESLTLQAVSIAVSQGGSAIDSTTLTSLKFNGNTAITIAPFDTQVSDPVAFALKPGMHIAITTFYGNLDESSSITSHVASRTDSYILPGDQTSLRTFNSPTITAHWFHISAIDVLTQEPSACIGILGDSITDGYGLSGGLQNRWPDIFSQQLLNDSRTKKIGVLNLGIGGSTLIGSGIDRYKDDLLAQTGIKYIIVFYGTNDIYSNASADEIIKAYHKIITDARAQNIKIYGATITPFKGSGHYSKAHEIVRKNVNKWIRTPGNFDAYIDFDKILRDPADPEKILKNYTEDWLHPNIEGYVLLGKSVNLNLFSMKEN
ncbi:SGNH/GDSL hydrolase family protein [Leeuwenhoekiella sp. MAR_2009_132]|uniref:SGNH/GDSL hydrolase family protein n=1 Tax=Leeuwenhoekiella sp. MAR_2009_132 TaxID=1392489 RepID=UPI0005682F3B|nr:SGNH/GDSL hydrolase family protein [Leeuwenhoekiella sp. MAR_2009_132]